MLSHMTRRNRLLIGMALILASAWYFLFAQPSSVKMANEGSQGTDASGTQAH